MYCKTFFCRIYVITIIIRDSRSIFTHFQIIIKLTQFENSTNGDLLKYFK